LISGILIRAKGRPHYFGSFHKRRALRIFPIYYLFVAFAFALGTRWSMPTHDLWRAVIYIQNYRVPGVPQRIPSFFGGHTWSLAVEEQFYLLWPALVLLLSQRQLLGMCCALVLGALAFRLVAFEVSRDPALWVLYGWLPSNIDCLAGGAIVAILHHERRLEPRAMLGVAAVAALALAALILHLSWDDWQTSDIWLHVRANTLLNTVLGALSAALVGYFALRPAWPLSGGVLRRVGRISYGLYLYHVPVYYFVDLWTRRVLKHYYRAPLKIAATFAVASLSWYLLERRLLKKPSRPAP
jgi:peptidoglycan/LPS O-acetylase OafA/YrhL